MSDKEKLAYLIGLMRGLLSCPHTSVVHVHLRAAISKMEEDK